MGICPFCHRSAGLFRSAHRACIRRFEQARRKLIDLLDSCFEQRRDVSEQHERIVSLCREGHLDDAELGAACAEALDGAIFRSLRVGLISREESDYIARFIEYTGLPQSLLNARHSLERLVQAQILGDLFAGSPPESRITTEGDIPVELPPGETLLWLAGNVICCRQESRPQEEVPTVAASLCMGRGRYYPIDCCDAEPPGDKELQPLGHGLAALSDKSLYFSSPMLQIRLPYAEVSEAHPFRSGISLRSGTSGPLYFFSGLDPWFCLNLVANLTKPPLRSPDAVLGC